MDFALNYIGKELHQLDYEDMENFFREPQTESDTLEFKSFVAEGPLENKYRSIFKSICSFLNSEGGLLIWGAPNGYVPEGRNEKIFKGELSLIDQVIEKDRLINRITDNIIPNPSGLRAQIIEHEENCLCVFEIDKSNYVPHQFGNIYYMRIDGQNRAAPHHYVEALFRQIKYPELEGYIKFNRITRVQNAFRLNITTFIFNWSRLQNETRLSFVINSLCGVFGQYENPLVGSDRRYGLHGHQRIQGSIPEVLHFGAPYNDDENLIYTDEALQENNQSEDLILGFGGKSSPFKTSHYSLEFRNVDMNNPNTLITNMEENDLMADRNDRLGMIKEEQIKQILGR